MADKDVKDAPPETPPEVPPGTDPLALPEAGAPIPPKITKAGKAKETNYFCLNADHPGVGALRAELYDESRHFSSSDGGAPTCPKCNKSGSSLVVDDPTQLPPSIQMIKDRFEAAERGR